MWWMTLSHVVSWTTCSSTQQRPKSWWWIWGEPGHQWPQFPSWDITWTSLNTTNIWGCSLTINWTGLRTLKSFTRRDRAASIFWGGSAPFTSAEGVLWVCNVLGQQTESCRSQQTQQADRERQWRCGGAGLFDSSVRQEDAGSHSCLWPLNFTAPLSDDRTQMAIYKKTDKNKTIFNI